MFDFAPTSEHTQLPISGGDPKTAAATARPNCEINFTPRAGSAISRYLEASLAPETRRGYGSDLKRFCEWGGTVPASPEMVADYVADHAEKLAVATLKRRLVAIAKAHDERGLDNPVASPLVTNVMRGIKRVHGKPQRQAAPLLKTDLEAVVAAIGGDSLRDTRDSALLLLGFAGAFRRASLVALRVEHVRPVPSGIVITIERGKTDQTGKGRTIMIRRENGPCCPVSALEEWLVKARIESGPLFRSICRYGYLAAAPLSGQTVALVLKDRAKAAGLDPKRLSGHSLRAGYATSAAMSGASPWKIMATTQHRTFAALNRYVREAELMMSDLSG